ncbi:MAG: hypothetical protein PHU33_16480 [Bacteroidales bacterium]|nr:hypothetical protein [Bacteroidales bacterium]
MNVTPTYRFTVTPADGSKSSYFTSCFGGESERSINAISHKATLKIPASCVLRAGAVVSQSQQTAKKFTRGDKIKMEIGYDGRMNTVFDGFIKRVNLTTPTELECEGYEFQLRHSLGSKTFKTVSLKELLSFAISGTDITLSSLIPSMSFSNFVIKQNEDALDVLQRLTDKYGLTVYLNEKELYAGLAYIPDLGSVKYKIGFNTIKDNQLKYRNADDVKLKVKAIWVKDDNSRVEATVGDDSGSLRTLFFFDVSSLDDLKKLASQEIQKYKYSGWEGKITTWCEPFAIPGMKAVIIDPQYSERAGTYYIIGVKYTFGIGGIRLIVEIGIKL